MKYLLPGSITLAMFVSVMIGGGMLYIDDKARACTRASWSPPSPGWSWSWACHRRGPQGDPGRLRAHRAGLADRRAGRDLPSLAVVQLVLMIVATSFAFNGMMFLLMVRVEDPLVPRAMFGILNTLLYFPSGAIYPMEPFRHGCGSSPRGPVHLRGARLQGAAAQGRRFAALVPDLLFLGLSAPSPWPWPPGCSSAPFKPHRQ